VDAGKPLDTDWGDLSAEVASPFEGPIFLQPVVERAIGVWTEGWFPGFGRGIHARQGQKSLQKQFRGHNLKKSSMNRVGVPK
jgi:hypothetical protein